MCRRFTAYVTECELMSPENLNVPITGVRSYEEEEEEEEDAMEGVVSGDSAVDEGSLIISGGTSSTTRDDEDIGNNTTDEQSHRAADSDTVHITDNITITQPIYVYVDLTNIVFKIGAWLLSYYLSSTNYVTILIM